MNNLGNALENGAKVCTAAVIKKPEAAMFTRPDVINFYHTGKRFYLENLVRFSVKHLCN